MSGFTEVIGLHRYELYATYKGRPVQCALVYDDGRVAVFSDQPQVDIHPSEATDWRVHDTGEVFWDGQTREPDSEKIEAERLTLEAYAAVFNGVCK